MKKKNKLHDSEGYKRYRAYRNAYMKQYRARKKHEI